VNLVGHIEVARRLEPNWFGGAESDGGVGYLLGSVLPDLASMGQFRLTGSPTDPSVSAGVDLHHRTDAVFHRHQHFVSTSATITRELKADGLGVGASMACGHVGYEVLLDGHLLQTRHGLIDATATTMQSVSTGHFDLGDLVVEARREEWRAHLERVADFRLPESYDAPHQVARLLYRICSRRPRLGFDENQIDLVAARFEQHHPAIKAGAAELVQNLHDDLSEEIAARPLGQPREGR
jgi:hypothetical protein